MVALQEVDNKTNRTGKIDQAAELSRLTKMFYIFGSNIEFQGGHYGNAILSRFPVVKKTTYSYLISAQVNNEAYLNP